jgi:hypothetical protein
MLRPQIYSYNILYHPIKLKKYKNNYISFLEKAGHLPPSEFFNFNLRKL